MPTDLPPDLRISERPALEGPDWACLVATAGDPRTGPTVGVLSWHRESGTIEHVDVAEDHLRRGIATALWHAARELTPHLRHDGEEITADGLAWARTVGGPWNTGTAPSGPR